MLSVTAEGQIEGQIEVQEAAKRDSKRTDRGKLKHRNRSLYTAMHERRPSHLEIQKHSCACVQVVVCSANKFSQFEFLCSDHSCVSDVMPILPLDVGAAEVLATGSHPTTIYCIWPVSALYLRFLKIQPFVTTAAYFVDALSLDSWHYDRSGLTRCHIGLHLINESVNSWW